MAKTTFSSGSKGGALRGRDPHLSGTGKNNVPKGNTHKPLR